MGVDEAARIKEREHHLLAVANLHLCLQWPRLALQGPLLAHSFDLWSVVRNQRLVHCNNVVQHGEPAELDGVDKVLADSLTFLFLHFNSSFGTQQADFFTRHKSSIRIRQMVLRHTPWAAARDLGSIRRSAAMAAATEAMRLPVRIVLVGSDGAGLQCLFQPLPAE